MSDPELIETDPEVFQCETCEVSDRIQGLDAENARAWRLFQSLQTRFLVENRAVGMALAVFTADDSPEDVADLISRLSVLYDVYFPPPKAPRGPRTEHPH